MIGALGKMTADELVELGKRKAIFPLHTMQTMGERWGQSRQTVNNWRKRHDDFPKPIDGVVVPTDKTPAYFPLYEVERYERAHGLVPIHV